MKDTSVSVRERIGIVIANYSYGASPILINTAEELAERGYTVDFLVEQGYRGDLAFESPDIRIFEGENVGGETAPAGTGRRIIGRALRRAKDTLRKIPWVHDKAFERWVLRNTSLVAQKTAAQHRTGPPFRLLIGVLPTGLAAASKVGRQFGIPVVYFNLELFHGPDLQTLTDHVMKRLELDTHRHAAMTITLDEQRARLLSDENRVPLASIVTLPVGLSGPAHREPSRFLHERHQLAADKRVVLYAGYVGDCMMLEEVIQSASGWPDDWVLVINSHGNPDVGFAERIKRYASDRVHFSWTPVPWEQFPKLLASADVGIALYRDAGKNLTLIGSASHKLAYYAKCGLPTVVNDFPSIASIVERHGAGVAIAAPEELRSAISEILAKHDSMRQGAFRCYEQEFVFSASFKPVAQRLDKLMGRTLNQ